MDDCQELSLKEALLADLNLDTGLSDEKKQSVVTAILEMCRQEGIDVDMPADILPQNQINKLVLLFPAFNDLLKSVHTPKIGGSRPKLSPPINPTLKSGDTCQ